CTTDVTSMTSNTNCPYRNVSVRARCRNMLFHADQAVKTAVIANARVAMSVTVLSVSVNHVRIAATKTAVASDSRPTYIQRMNRRGSRADRRVSSETPV